jgi:hypothetical protein
MGGENRTRTQERACLQGHMTDLTYTQLNMRIEHQYGNFLGIY